MDSLMLKLNIFCEASRANISFSKSTFLGWDDVTPYGSVSMIINGGPPLNKLDT